jgi:hypothetical protein
VLSFAFKNVWAGSSQATGCSGTNVRVVYDPLPEQHIPHPHPIFICRRQQQIESLKASNPHISPVTGDPNSWDVGLLLQEVRVIVRVRT